MEETIDFAAGKIWLPSGVPSNQVEDGNIDVHVYVFENGEKRHYAGTFYTLCNIDFLLRKYEKQSECANGLYTYAPHSIIMRSITKDTLRATVESLVETREIQHAMLLVENQGDNEI